MSTKLDNPFEPCDILSGLMQALDDFVFAPTDMERAEARREVLDPFKMQRLHDLEGPFLQAAIKCGYSLEHAKSAYVGLKTLAGRIGTEFFTDLDQAEAINLEKSYKSGIYYPYMRPSVLSSVRSGCLELGADVYNIAMSITKTPRLLLTPPAFMTIKELEVYTGL